MDIPHEKRFHFRDGSSVGSLEELKARLEGISYQEFYHHVNAEKNDFANWVKYVLNDEELAESLQKVSSIVETVEIINDASHPQPVTPRDDDLQRKIEEEALQIHLPVEEVPTTAPAEAPEAADLEALADELNREAPKDETDVEQEERPAATAHALSDHDYTRLIVKDFMYGLVFGLILGLILGRIISF